MATIVVPTNNPLITSPFVDPDESSYGETPVEKDIELRVAASPAGSGALVEARNSTNYIVEAERTGETLDLLDATAGWAATVGAVAAVATNPTGYGGTSLQYSPGALINPAVGMISKTIPAAIGANLLSAYSGATIVRVNLRSSNITALDVRIRFEKTGAGAWTADYSLTNPGAINTYAEAVNVLRGSTPTASTGTPWATAPDKLSFIVRPTAGTQTYVVLLRDLRIGQARTAKTVPDGHLAYETSYDLRVRYKDAMGFGPWSAWSTVKPSQPPVVVVTSPAAAAVVTDPTPDYVHTFTSPGAKTQASSYVDLYEVVGGQDQLVDRYYSLTPTGLTITQPALVLRHGKTYAIVVSAVDTDGLVGSAARQTFTTNFSQPAAPVGVTVTTDDDSSSAAVAWTTVIGANYEFRVYRRQTGGILTRISATGATWEDGDPIITASPLVDYHVPENVGVEYLVSVHSGSASGEGESATTSASGSIVQDRYMNVIPANATYTFEVRYVKNFTDTPELQVEATEAIDRETIHVSVGELLQPKIAFDLFIDRGDRSIIDYLRVISADRTYGYSILKTPRGDVYRVQYGTVPRTIEEGGLTSTHIEATVVAV